VGPPALAAIKAQLNQALGQWELTARLKPERLLELYNQALFARDLWAHYAYQGEAVNARILQMDTGGGLLLEKRSGERFTVHQPGELRYTALQKDGE